MSETTAEEISVLSSIYCGEGEFVLLQQSGQDGVIVQINCTGGGEDGFNTSLLFHLHPSYPSCPPDISVSSTTLSRTQCQSARQKLQEQASELPKEPMIHQLVEFFQDCMELTEARRGEEEAVKPREKEDEWTTVLLLDHMRSQKRYIGLMERWSQQLQIAGTLLLGQSILVILQGARHYIKEFCHRLKTVKVDVDSSGKKCKERMMKVLIETPSSSSCLHSLQGFIVKNYDSVTELTAAFEHLHMADLYQRIFPSPKD